MFSSESAYFNIILYIYVYIYIYSSKVIKWFSNDCQQLKLFWWSAVIVQQKRCRICTTIDSYLNLSSKIFTNNNRVVINIMGLSLCVRAAFWDLCIHCFVFFNPEQIELDFDEESNWLPISPHKIITIQIKISHQRT